MLQYSDSFTLKLLKLIKSISFEICSWYCYLVTYNYKIHLEDVKLLPMNFFGGGKFGQGQLPV